VRDQAGEQRSAALLDGQPVIGFQIVPSWGASARSRLWEAGSAARGEARSGQRPRQRVETPPVTWRGGGFAVAISRRL